MLRILALLAALMFWTSPGWARDYLFDGSQDLQQIHKLNLQAGDRILLKGQNVFSGSIFLDPSFVHGPIEISSYGTGRAIIRPAHGPGLQATNLGNLTISNLIIQGFGVNQSKANGVLVVTDKKINQAFSHIDLDHLDVSGFHGAGVKVESVYGMSHFKDVHISYIVAHNNGMAGIVVNSDVYPTPHFHEGVFISNCIAHHNLGNPENTSQQTGNGIVIGSVENGVIEYSEAYENGKLCAPNPQGGSLGIWAWNSDHVVIEYNRSHDNRSGNGADGGGFDLDGSVSNSTVRYNLSYNNDGYGYELFDFYGHLMWHGPEFQNNLVYDNVSIHDGDGNGLGGIYVSGPLNNTKVYNNIIFSSANKKEQTCSLEEDKVTGQGLDVSGNYFLAAPATNFVKVDSAGPQGSVILNKNAYIKLTNSSMGPLTKPLYDLLPKPTLQEADFVNVLSGYSAQYPTLN